MNEGKYFGAVIRVVKSLNKHSHYMFGSESVIHERVILATDKKDVCRILAEKYPQFFPEAKVFTRETKDSAQFFYVVIYEHGSSAVKDILSGEWVCSNCGIRHESKVHARPVVIRSRPDLLFCPYDKINDIHCAEQYKEREMSSDVMPDNDFYISSKSSISIYLITEKSTGKKYVGKTKNAPFFRWWEHLTRSRSPFGLYLRETPLSNWTFEVIETLPPETKNEDVLMKESKYIVSFDSINNGFNSVISNSDAIEKSEV